MYYTYMLRCKDKSIYTGITKNINKRLKEHINKDKKCAKYTYYHDVIKLETAWISENRSSACKLEYWIKKLNKMQKEKIIEKPQIIYEFLNNKIDINLYKNIEMIDVKK